MLHPLMLRSPYFGSALPGIRDEEDNVELQPDSPTREAETEGVDFENFVAIEDEVATSTEPDPQALFQTILAEAGMSVETSCAGDQAEEESDNETEMVQKLKEEDVGRMLAQMSR
ncbi:Armadillo repeat-containing protein 6 [Trichuris trichiura]|uniref:Armadillo repeat-containing protein 6 n=1 Tax=Trichuris trichiura TaxID=36087 RepID=A0A077ZG09_TRITR|nr:Armadillo repeat-containing protein 6 [Trichuris trichiura]